MPQILLVVFVLMTEIWPFGSLLPTTSGCARFVLSRDQDRRTLESVRRARAGMTERLEEVSEGAEGGEREEKKKREE